MYHQQQSGTRSQAFRFCFSPLALLCALCVLCGKSAAALDPETDKAYRLQVVLRIAEHRLLTPVFQDQIRRELRDSLQAALGDLGRVELVRDHSLLKEVEAKGLQQALDAWNVLSDTKVHFVLIDFANGRYQIQARQYDGLTGLASPVVRRSQTTDRQLVAREAALLVDKDFGLVGTVADDTRAVPAKGDRVDVVLKGGKLGVPLDHWVKKDEVFAVAQIVSQGGRRQRSFRVPWTLLRVAEEPKDGLCRCRVFFRHQNPLPSGATVLGYRCLKLGTSRGTIRLRVVADDRSGTPLAGLQILFSDSGFQDAPLERASTKADGLVKTERLYANVAFVRILRANIPLAQVPVEILDDRAITCAVSIQPGAEQRGQLHARRDRWVRRLYDGLDVSNSLVRELNAATSPAREETLAKAGLGLKGLLNDIADLTGELEALQKDAQAARIQLDLADGEQRLQELRGRREELERFVSALTQIVKEEKDPRRQRWRHMLEEARLHEDQAEFSEAIALYEKVLAEGGEDGRIRQHLESLRRSWALKDRDAHAKARSFVYEVWPKLTSASQMKERLADARQSLQTCRQLGDYLTPKMFLRANTAHTADLEKEAESLRPQENEDDRKKVDTILALIEDLRKLDKEARELARKAQTPTK
jgi:hypothetical protein